MSSLLTVGRRNPRRQHQTPFSVFQTYWPERLDEFKPFIQVLTQATTGKGNRPGSGLNLQDEFDQRIQSFICPRRWRGRLTTGILMPRFPRDDQHLRLLDEAQDHPIELLFAKNMGDAIDGLIHDTSVRNTRRLYGAVCDLADWLDRTYCHHQHDGSIDEVIITRNLYAFLFCRLDRLVYSKSITRHRADGVDDLHNQEWLWLNGMIPIGIAEGNEFVVLSRPAQ